MTEALQMRSALADFLRTRRARLSPADVGLPGAGRRRTPGLRREEVSSLANVGISWYTALEQGRDVRPSESILNSLADVLRLTIDERVHLFSLAGQHLVITPTIEMEEEKCPAIDSLRNILNALEPNPAYILGQRWNYRAWNAMADRVFSITEPIDQSGSPYADNLLWQFFMCPDKRSFYVQWDEVARNLVAQFRADIEKYMCDTWLVRFIDDLNQTSPDFHRLWQQHDVQSYTVRRKEIRHPLVGLLSFDHTPLQLIEFPSLKLIVYTPTPESIMALRQLQDQSAPLFADLSLR